MHLSPNSSLKSSCSSKGSSTKPRRAGASLHSSPEHDHQELVDCEETLANGTGRWGGKAASAGGCKWRAEQPAWMGSHGFSFCVGISSQIRNTHANLNQVGKQREQRPSSSSSLESPAWESQEALPRPCFAGSWDLNHPMPAKRHQDPNFRSLWKNTRERDPEPAQTAPPPWCSQTHAPALRAQDTNPSQ